jgi:O-antigen/teichoic acid export membrane protein
MLKLCCSTKECTLVQKAIETKLLASKTKANMNPDLIQKILSGTRWATMFRLIAQAFTWVSTIFVVRLIAPEEYGLNAMLEVPLVIFGFFSTLSLEAALVQRRELEHEHLSGTFGLLLLINGAIFIAFFIASPTLADYFNEPRLDSIAKAMAFVFLLVPFRVVPDALLSRSLDFKLKAQLELVAAVTSSTTTLVLAYFGYGVWALISGVLVNRVLLATLLMIMRPWFIWPTISFRATRQLVVFGGLLTVSSAFLVLSDMVIRVIAGPVIGAAQLGMFAMANHLAQMPLSKGMPIINQTVLPAFSRLQDDKSMASYYLTRLVGVASLTFFPMLVGFACIADTFVFSILGEKWAESIPLIVIISLGVIFRLINLIHTSVITGMGHADVAMKLGVTQLLIQLVFVLLLLHHGIIVLAISWGFTELVITIIFIHVSKPVLSTKYISIPIALKPALIASVVMACVVLLIRNIPISNAFLMLFTQVTCGAGVYYLTVRYMFAESYGIARRAILGDR